ncbi:MAG: OmpA family protein [Prevotellaceae bacterium]|nr:OmpA family protein [Prevotellaceae bacterium]
MKQFSSYLLCALLLASCGTAGKLEKANRLFDEGGYAAAAERYKKIIRKIPKAQAEQPYFNYAECYRRLGNWRNAETAYTGLLRQHKTPENPEIYLHYGQVLFANEKYDKAEEQFLLYRQQRPNDPQAAAALASLELAKNYRAGENAYQVELAPALNTRANDFAPAYGADDYETLLFTSTRKEDNLSKKTYDVTGEAYSDLFFSRLPRNSKWTKPQNMGEEINTKYEDGAAAFNHSYTVLYFTRCMKVKREKAGCKIFSIERNDNEWGKPQDLKLMPDSITAAHPALSGDDLTLYFVSDMDGGMGKMDIWKVTRSGSSDDWGEPVNAGVQINTPGNEMYPFARGNSLYFASDGHPGFGGLDIFKATPDSAAGWSTENMGRPVNSSADDFSIILEQENERGYFASRRREKGAKGGDDIYRLALDITPIEYHFEGMVKDAATNSMLENAEIRLVGSNGAVLRKRTEANGAFYFRVNPGLYYLVLASRNGYLNAKLRFSSTGWDNGHVHRDTFALTSTAKPIEIPNIFFDFGKATLSDASRTALDSLVDLMKDNPSIMIELRAHTDSRGSDETNDDLSQRRAQAVVDYLITNGIDEPRLTAVGLGESEPKTVTEPMSKQHTFLRTGQKLTEKFITSLPSEGQQEICHAFNRRTELQVTRSDYLFLMEN